MSRDGLQTDERGDCCQQPQDVQNQHGPKYDNDTPNNWLRGNGMKPGFDRNGAPKGR